MNTENVEHIKDFALPLFLRLSHIISLCLCDVRMNGCVRGDVACVFRMDSHRGGPAGRCPRGSDLIKAVSVRLQVHKQPACIHTAQNRDRERERGRETPPLCRRSSFGQSCKDQKASFCLKSRLCGGQKASASTTPHSPQYARASKRESRLCKGWTFPTGRK